MIKTLVVSRTRMHRILWGCSITTRKPHFRDDFHDRLLILVVADAQLMDVTV
jgi:hypothetical protein